MRTLRPTAGFLAVVGVAAGLGLFCWVILTPPDGSCGAGVLQDTLDAYRAIVVPAHLLALLVLGGVVAQMSRLSSGRVSRGTAIALAITGLLAVAAYADLRVFVLLALPAILVLGALGSALVVVAVVALVRLHRKPPTPQFTGIAAWSAIAVLPAHLGVLLWHTNPYFCFF
jgi:hypothetical protein